MAAPSGGSRRARRSILLLAVIWLALTGCTPPRPLSGEAALEYDVRTTFNREWQRAAVAVIEDDDVTMVYVDADERTVFEIGSITKALTGLLLAIAIERGEVSLDDRLGRYLPLGDAPAASVTLRSLATHSSGLPIEPTDPEWGAGAADDLASQRDPYDSSLAALLDLAREQELASDDRVVYSNFGASLLGHALAAAAGTDYATLLTERVLEPIGMEHAAVVGSPDQVPASHAGGFTAAGKPVEPWSLGAFAPAGGVHATLPDMVALARAVLDGPLADSAALEPIAPGFAPNLRFGYFWAVADQRGRILTAHDGRTAGFGACLLLDREASSAAIVLVNTDRRVDQVATEYLPAPDPDD